MSDFKGVPYYRCGTVPELHRILAIYLLKIKLLVVYHHVATLDIVVITSPASFPQHCRKLGNQGCSYFRYKRESNGAGQLHRLE